jgi:MFS family permease
MTLMGLVHSYTGLLVARWFLGVAESGFFPAATYLLTLWYKRYEYQQRFAIFYSMASMAGAFSGLLAFAIEKMDGVAGRTGWQWIFIIEGISQFSCDSLFRLTLLNRPCPSRVFLRSMEIITRCTGNSQLLE